MSEQPTESRSLLGRLLQAAVVGGATILLLLAAVHFASGIEASSAPMSYTLSPITERKIEAEEDQLFTPAPALLAQIEGGLELLFGTPQAPQYLALDGWGDDFDPNNVGFTLSDEAFDEVKADNRVRFARQIELIEAHRYAEVPEPRNAQNLWRRWQAEHLPGLLADPDAEVDIGGGELSTRQDEALYLFESWYPTLAESASLYRVQCLHCHGVEGGGDGPTAEYLYPLPRDYRQGLFKWTAVERNKRPRRADLLHVLEYGVPTTAMPPFARFSRGELEGLVDYVRLLSIRGEVEGLLTYTAVDEGSLPPGALLDNYEIVWDRWRDTDGAYVWYDGEVPRPTPESVERGRAIFMDAGKGNCFSCHGERGDGEGPSLWESDSDGRATRRQLDEWGKALDEVGLALAHGEPGRPQAHESAPRDLNRGIFRGGSRPIDLYRRIKNGITGTIMPALDPTVLSEEDLWALVHYVMGVAERGDIARDWERREAERKARAAAAGAHGHAASDPEHPTGHGAQ